MFHYGTAGTCCPSRADGGTLITPAIWQWSWRQLAYFLSHASLRRLLLTFTPTSGGRWSLIKLVHNCERLWWTPPQAPPLSSSSSVSSEEQTTHGLLFHFSPNFVTEIVLFFFFLFN